jgi:nicotinamidase-related amidase
MPLDLTELLAGRALPTGRPLEHSAGRAGVLTMELQRGVVGDRSTFPELARAARNANVGVNTARLCAAVRALGLPVIHCTAEFRSDRSGTVSNTPLHSAVLSRPEHLLAGSDAVELIAELDAQPGDLVSSRRHGVSPFTGTNLDSILRNLGVQVVIATGVSVNVGIFGLCVEAVNLGYQVIVARDAVCGVPADYAELVIERSLALLATISTVEEIVAALGTLGERDPRVR